MDKFMFSKIYKICNQLVLIIIKNGAELCEIFASHTLGRNVSQKFQYGNL